MQKSSFLFYSCIWFSTGLTLNQKKTCEKVIRLMADGDWRRPETLWLIQNAFCAHKAPDPVGQLTALQQTLSSGFRSAKSEQLLQLSRVSAESEFRKSLKNPQCLHPASKSELLPVSPLPPFVTQHVQGRTIVEEGCLTASFCFVFLLRPHLLPDFC